MFFYLIAHFLSSIASFLFPLFASYKALKTSDPAQLTPWLMYWVVFGCGLFVESWTEWILAWVPFYYYIRLLFILYLVSPQTQGARFLYETYIHHWIEEYETQIDDFISRAHDRLKAAGMAYLKQAIETVKTRVLGLPPGDPHAADAAASSAVGPQSYTQALLARFSVPAARWTAAATTSQTGTDFYNLLAGAVSALGAANVRSDASAGAGTSAVSDDDPFSRSGTLIPPDLRGASEKMNFITAQRARLSLLLGALEREAQQLQREETLREAGRESGQRRAYSMALDGEGGETDTGLEDSPVQRPPSGLSGFSGLSKSRSETDFEKIDVDSGAEDTAVRRRTKGESGGGGWLPWQWGAPGEGAQSGYKED